MFSVHTVSAAVFCCCITMLGWGSWANTQKLTGKAKWPFQLFYVDYGLGVFLFSLVFAATLGSNGSSGEPAWANLSHARLAFIAPALISGAIFNVANFLLVVAIDAAGMSVAFPIGVGLALVIGTVESFMELPKGDPRLLFLGVALIVLAMILSALAHRMLPKSAVRRPLRGLVFSVIAGCMMGFFYPQLVRSISPAFNSAPIVPGMLTPYAALIFFGISVLVSGVIISGIFMQIEGVRFRDYFGGTFRLHWVGILGGCIWMLALSLNILASGVAGPAISYALGQGATLIAAIWGVFVWHEFRSAPSRTAVYVSLMFAGYAAGLILIGLATR